MSPTREQFDMMYDNILTQKAEGLKLQQILDLMSEDFNLHFL